MSDSLLRIPPAWAFGVLYGTYANQENSLQQVEQLRRDGYPIDALWIDSWFWDYENQGNGPKGYLSFVPDQSAYPNPSALWKTLESYGIKSGLWVWDAILQDGNEETFREFEREGYFRRVYPNKDKWHNRPGVSVIGEINFKNPKAAERWKSKLMPFFTEGLDFLKLDRSSEIEFLEVAFDLSAYHGAESKGRGFLLSHCHDLEDPRLKKYPGKWTGDAKIAWTQPNYPDLSIYAMGALKENVEMLANPKKEHHHVPFLGNDAGGYDFFGSTDTTHRWDELYIRWIQFSSFAPLMMVFTTHKNPRENLPFNFSKQAQDNFKRYALLRQSLFPFRYSSALHQRVYGEKMIQGDSTHEHQFLLGGQLLVAPIVEKNGRNRLVSLPEGSWINYWTKKPLQGGQRLVVNAPLMQLPLFIKSGSILPLLPKVTQLQHRSRDTLILALYPDGESQYTLMEDDGESDEYLTHRIAETQFRLSQSGKTLHIDPVKGGYTGMPNTRILLIEFVTLSPKSLAAVTTEGLKQCKKLNSRFVVPLQADKGVTLQWK